MFAELVNDLQTVLNRHSREEVSNTPDFILAQFLADWTKTGQSIL